MELFDLRLENKKHEYNEIYTFSFSTDAKISFTAGQYIHFGFPTGQKDKSRVHHMSFASPPDERIIQFSMDLSSGSWFKTRMASLKIGDNVKAFKVGGNFIVAPDRKKDLVFIAGGIGITPIRSIILDLAKKGLQCPWTLLHISRDQHLYQEELSAFAARQWRVDRSNIDDIWPEVIENGTDATYYVCGSERFVEGLTAKLSASGIDDIITENFDR